MVLAAVTEMGVAGALDILSLLLAFSFLSLSMYMYMYVLHYFNYILPDFLNAIFLGFIFGFLFWAICFNLT